MKRWVYDPHTLEHPNQQKGGDVKRCSKKWAKYPRFKLRNKHRVSFKGFKAKSSGLSEEVIQINPHAEHIIISSILSSH